MLKKSNKIAFRLQHLSQKGKKKKVQQQQNIQPFTFLNDHLQKIDGKEYP